jgi:stearoyl-CoA desaturase (delta-9 desaturase)
VGVDWKAIALCVFFFLIRKFGITGGYHRYFSHRSFKTSRAFQFVLAYLGGMATQKGALWWAAHHRHHHKHSDTDEDIHSAERDGFWWSHVGWVLSEEYDTYDEKSIGDLTKYPELMWLEKYHFVPPITLALFCYLVYGWMGLIWGYCASTVILWHTTFAINSFCHLIGHRRYETGESSKNSLWLAIVTLGEGWHNNHHHYPISCRQGFYWWEIDVTYYCIWLLSKVGIVWDIKAPPKRLLTKDAWTATPYGKPDAVRPSPRNIPPMELPAI